MLPAGFRYPILADDADIYKAFSYIHVMRNTKSKKRKQWENDGSEHILFTETNAS